jgi:RND family efflux transporter MFP subunit
MRLAPKYTLFLAVGIVLILALIIVTRPQPVAQQVELPPVKVEVASVKLADLRPSVTVGGYLQPLQQARLQFQVTGRLRQQLVEPGQQVDKGDALLRLEQDDYRDLATEARAQLAEEKAAVARDRKLLQLSGRNLKLQQAEVARQERLGNESLASKAALDAARQRLIQLQSDQARLQYSVDSADARLDKLAAAQRRAERNLARTTLRAPFAGTVNQVLVEVGDDVAARDVVLELLDLSQLEFYAEIEREVAAQLKLGQSVQVETGGQSYTAHIIALQQHPDPDTYTYALRARFDNPGILSGAAAEARLQLPELKQVRVVPVSALVHDNGRIYLFVVDQGVLHQRPVKLGPRQGDSQTILSGVAAGEQVVARGGAGLSDGLKVQY